MNRSNKKADKTLDLILALSVFISVFVFSKTRNLKLSIIFFIITAIFIIVLAIAIGIIKKNAIKKKYLNSGISIVDEMTGEDFEKFLSVHFQKLGYKVELTPASNDYGADLILKKGDLKLVLQAKRWKNKIGISAIQEITAAIKYYNADKGIVITNNFFTNNAYELALKNNIELWNRNKLIEIMSSSNGQDIATNLNTDTIENYENSKNQREICPRCGNELTIRKGYNGKFWGCTNYPKCRFTKNI